MRAISLGWGVQSFTLAAMVALGELPSVDVAIHADTTFESILTYQFAARWTGWLEERGVKVVTTKNSHPISKLLPGGRIQVDIPTYVIGEKGNGQTRRQCTGRWKIDYIRRYLQANRNKSHVDQLIGISLDEFQRMRTSDVQYITNTYPLVDKRMTRADCVLWLDRHGLEIPPKSACTFCPFHSMAEWRRIKNIPADWAEAVAVDEAIRNIDPGFIMFVHRSCKPLAEINIRTPEEKGQLSLWDDECSGICGV